MQHFVTIIQQGTSPKVVEASSTLNETLTREGIDTESFVVLRGGAPADLHAPITSDLTVTATKKSVGASGDFFVTIIQQGTSPKVVDAGYTLRDTLENEGIDTESFVVLRGGVPADLDAPVSSDMTVTATKKSVGA